MGDAPMATKKPAKMLSFSLASFLVRLLFSLLLVFATYNPSGYSFYHWVFGTDVGPLSLKVVATLLLAIVYYAVLRVVFSAFRRSGLIFASLAALLFSIELVAVSLPDTAYLSWGFYLLLTQYIVLISVALVIAFGVSWSSLVERLTGQLQKRYVRY